ncbi:putative endonuclease [Neolewinella xylanilytica]|uniref:Putative endonuclease n=1 Tax=Neolewinella xylanilytica TaxID=1514080 RepID=A0A2S6I2R3_9BACT|nr:putative endonuclease [Neolewinella xylanilytica]
MFYVYILYSERIHRCYIGSTALAPKERLQQHNSVDKSTPFTAKGQPWMLVSSMVCTTRLQALRVERHIKRMKSKVYIQNLVTYFEMREKLIARYAEH